MARVAAERQIPNLDDVDWSRLSEEGRWVLFHVAIPHACGLTYIEVGERIGKNRRFVREALARLADELAALAAEDVSRVDLDDLEPKPLG